MLPELSILQGRRLIEEEDLLVDVDHVLALQVGAEAPLRALHLALQDA